MPSPGGGRSYREHHTHAVVNVQPEVIKELAFIQKIWTTRVPTASIS